MRITIDTSTAALLVAMLPLTIAVLLAAFVILTRTAER